MDCATIRSDVIGDFQEPYGAVLVEGDDMAALPFNRLRRRRGRRPARPALAPIRRDAGGNMTGFSNFEYTIGGKWLQILKEASPGVNRIGVVLNPEDPSGSRYLRAVEAEAPTSRVQLTRLAARDASQME